jgi:putative nucleotidyltransferase with HDIG domain
MRDQIERLFAGLLERISDRDLRRKVVQAWVRAAEDGGWKPDELESIPFTLLTETHGQNLIQHTIAVTEGALGLARAITEHADPPYSINTDWLIAGGLLHDVGKLLEMERFEGGFRKSHWGRCARHPISGAALATELSLPLEVVNTIACHSREGDGRPQRIETVLLHQADFACFNPLVMLEKGTLIT